MKMVPGPHIELGGATLGVSLADGMMVIVRRSMMVTQTRNFVGCWRKTLSSGKAAFGSCSLAGLGVMCRFDAVVMFVSAAMTAAQLFNAGETSWVTVGGSGGTIDGGMA